MDTITDAKRDAKTKTIIASLDKQLMGALAMRLCGNTLVAEVGRQHAQSLRLLRNYLARTISDPGCWPALTRCRGDLRVPVALHRPRGSGAVPTKATTRSTE